MPNSRPHDAAGEAGNILGRRMFAVAWVFFAVSAAWGLMLRWQGAYGSIGLNPSHVLHAHSHIGFLGWVFNAFFALAVRVFVGDRNRRGYARLFLVTQVAVLGMAVSYPLQGYGIASIVFSSLHMGCAAVFAWKLWHEERVAPAARGYLKAALVVMLLSGIGPVALGPLAATGMRDSPWYSLSIYFYLHFQYNGWFVLFLQAVWLQRIAGLVSGGLEGPARSALLWFLPGLALTFALSTLWLNPPGWVFAVAAVGGAAQLIGCGYFLRCIRPGFGVFATGPARLAAGLAGIALGAFLLKNLLQLAAAWPGLVHLVNHRFTAIAFLHLVFLFLATPMLIGWALDYGWIRVRMTVLAGIAAFFAGGLLAEAALFYEPWAAFAGWAAWPRLGLTLLVSAVLMTGGVMGTGVGVCVRTGKI